MSYQPPIRIMVGYMEWKRWASLSYKEQVSYLLAQANATAETTREILELAKTIAPLYVAEQQEENKNASTSS
jgi:hypothetical protein